MKLVRNIFGIFITDYNVMALICVSDLYDMDYLPFDQRGTKFDQNHKIR